jgi:ubiquinone biosynthesis protein
MEITQDKLNSIGEAIGEKANRKLDELIAQTPQLRKNATQGSVFNSLLEMKDFIGGLPCRLNRIMDAVTNSELEVKVKAVDAKMVVEGFQKIANRITAGIVLAALIMGATTLMQVETRFRIFGYPGLAILCFVAAAAGGFWLVISIFVHDHEVRKKSSRK